MSTETEGGGRDTWNVRPAGTTSVRGRIASAWRGFVGEMSVVAGAYGPARRGPGYDRYRYLVKSAHGPCRWHRVRGPDPLRSEPWAGTVEWARSIGPHVRG